MLKTILSLLFFVSLTSSSYASDKNLDFIMSFNQIESNCDKVQLTTSSSSEGLVVKVLLLDLVELGNPEFKAAILLSKFKLKNSNKLVAKRYSHYNGKKVREVYTLEKDDQGKLKSISLKRYKRSLVRFSYSLGGIICRQL